MGCDIHGVYQVKKDGDWKTVREIEHNRNYDTFAILANIRNGRGFAGSDTGDSLPFIQEDRGFPKDFSIYEDEYHSPSGLTEYTPNSDQIWMGDHSHGWVTLKEVCEFIEKYKNNTILKRAIVKEYEHKRLLKTGERPNRSYFAENNTKTEVLTQKEYQFLSSLGSLPEKKEIFVQHEWSEDLLEATYIPQIKLDMDNISEEYEVDQNDVRMVFGFDS